MATAEDIAEAIDEGRLLPALDALRANRAQAAADSDVETLAAVRDLATRQLPLLGGRFERSCALVIAAAEENIRVLTAPKVEPKPPRIPVVVLKPEPKPEPPPEPESEPEPEPEPAREPQPEPDPKPEPASEPEREPESVPVPEPEPDVPEPYLGRAVVTRHIDEARERLLEVGERLLAAFHGGLFVETDGRRRPLGGVSLHDYLLLTDRRVILWARGGHGGSESLPYEALTDIEAGKSVVSGRVSFAARGRRFRVDSMAKAEAERAAALLETMVERA
jgi:hypothetical protein